jgi:hypothetical protein
MNARNQRAFMDHQTQHIIGRVSVDHRDARKCSQEAAAS